MKKGFLVVVALFFALLAGAAVGAFMLAPTFLTDTLHTETVTINVEEGDSCIGFQRH